MKFDRPSSICSLIDGNDPDGTTQQLHQTSIRNFFIQQSTTATKQQQQKSTKRPTSSSTVISTESLIRSHQPTEATSKPSCFDDTIADLDASVILNETTNTPRHINKRTKMTTFSESKPKRPQQQLYIDLGQRNFAANNICTICGMLFVQGDPIDQRQHDKICHQYQFGVTWPLSSKVVPTQQNHPYKDRNNNNNQSDLLQSTTKRLSSSSSSLRPCHEWTLPKQSGSIESIQPPECRTKQRNNSKNRTQCHDLQRATIIEVRTFFWTTMFVTENLFGKYISGAQSIYFLHFNRYAQILRLGRNTN
jgi:zinc-finger of acetyl-transferase ESCO